ncbi:MAG: pilus assembly protein [Candidatus Limnocylindrales bacterium]|nr:pilus assembly protein [Candidatus Limnocylindrales bacterium]
MSARRRFGKPATRGQSLVEFALVLPVFLLLLFGVIDGGRAIFAYNQMSQVTRAVARVASTTCFETTPACDETTGSIATSIASQGAGYQSPVTWTVQCVDPETGSIRTSGSNICMVGDLVRVSIAASFSLLTPVASSFGPVNVGSTTEQEILQ